MFKPQDKKDKADESSGMKSASEHHRLARHHMSEAMKAVKREHKHKHKMAPKKRHHKKKD